jgi:hypothetical protein
MIYADIPMDRWLKKYPALAEFFPFCECDGQNLRPYLTFRSAGIECTTCNTCGWTGRTYKDNERNMALVYPLIGEEGET